jgi:hypothetical protein
MSWTERAATAGAGASREPIGHEPKLTRSALERRFLTLVRRAGITMPIVNEPLDVVGHPGIEPDFHWPAERVIVETDGRATHLTRAAFQADRRRDAALAADGYLVVRFTWDDVCDQPAVIVDRLRAVFARRGPSGSSW